MSSIEKEEFWELFTKDRERANRIIKRTDLSNFPEGMYHIVAECMVTDRQGNVLLTKRSANCKHHKLCWEFTTGSVMLGEDSVTGILRELREETGLEIRREDLHLCATQIMNCVIRDMFVACLEEIPFDKICLSEEETCDKMMMSLTEFFALMDNEETLLHGDTFVPAQYGRWFDISGDVLKLCARVYGTQTRARKTRKKEKNVVSLADLQHKKRTGPKKEEAPAPAKERPQLGIMNRRVVSDHDLE